jgi:hypothetical protein
MSSEGENVPPGGSDQTASAEDGAQQDLTGIAASALQQLSGTLGQQADDSNTDEVSQEEGFPCATCQDELEYEPQDEVTLDSAIPSQAAGGDSGGTERQSLFGFSLPWVPVAEGPAKAARIAVLASKVPAMSAEWEVSEGLPPAGGKTPGKTYLSVPFCPAGTDDENGEPVVFARYDNPDKSIYLPSVKKVSVSTYRATTRQIVLHETTDFNRILNRADVHFFVDMDGVIYQCSDAGSWQPHGSRGVTNLVSVGIELANNPWLEKPRNAELPPARDPITWLGVKGAKTYVLPHRHQMEKVVYLIARLCAQYPDIAPGWAAAGAGADLGRYLSFLNVWQYTDASRAVEDRFFLRADKPPNAPMEARLAVAGVVTHSITTEDFGPKGNRGDGIAIGLYAYYRIKRGLAPAFAYMATKARLSAGPASSSRLPRELAGRTTLAL